MTLNTNNESTRQAVSAAGFALLLAMAIAVLANYGIYPFRFTVPGDAVATARNLLAHEQRFRIATVCNLLFVVNAVVLLSALYVILKPVNRNLAMVAAFCRLVFALLWGLSALNGLGALRLLGSATYLGAFKADQLQALARLHLSANFDVYYVGLPFWGLASTVCGYLWFKSRHIPRALAAYGVISSAWCVISAFAFIIFPHFDATVGATWFDLPMVIFELTLGIWLLFKGLRPTEMTGTEHP